jgi:hypothetical protein
LSDLRELIKKDFSKLFEESNDGANKYSKLLANTPKERSFNEGTISPIIKDYYINNTISRFSKTMSECSRARQELRKRA